MVNMKNIRLYIKYITALAVLSAGFAACAAHSPESVSIEKVASCLRKAEAGDTILIADGIYKDVVLKWEGRAQASKPIVVMPENRGKVVITGKSMLKIYGEGLEVSSLIFKDGSIERGAVIEFRNSDALARGCRLTDCVIDSYNPARRDISYSYVHLYGRDNRVDHCSFLGKKNLGVTLTVLLNHDDCDENNHLIEDNYFGPRPVYGSNGAETIRVGTSQQCMQNSRTIIRNNLFHKCNGEVEVVSIKSCENVISGNAFYECEGVLALRHGDRNVASENIFVGNGVRNTGGIRIVGEDQKVLGNKMYSLAGTRFFSALALMYGVPNSLPNRYMQVKNTIIRENLFSDCASIDFETGKDYERTLAPVGTVFEDNSVMKEKLEAPSFESLAEGKGAVWYASMAECVSASPVVVKVGVRDNVPEIVYNAEPNTIVELADGVYEIESAIRVRTKLTLSAADGASPQIRFIGKSSDDFVTICDGAQLSVEGLTFDGVLTPGRSLARSGISTAADMIQPYNLVVSGCTFRNFGESGFIPVKGLKGTFAETVTIRDCTFEALSGDAINYAAELDDKGRYNADDMIIENCRFNRILGLPVNIYRGGSDESTAGPYVTLRNCVFDDCCNKVRGSVVRIIGAQVLDIVGNNFISSGRGGYSIRLDEAPWEKVSVRKNRFSNSGGILSNGKLN